MEGGVVRQRAVWAVVVLAAALCVGCADGSEESSYDETSAKALAGALASARSAGVDATQVEVLSGDEVTFAQYRAAVDRALGCMQEAGMEVVEQDVTRWNGRDLVTYAVGSGALPEDQGVTVQDDCYERYARYVDEFWQTSTPDGLAYEERRASALRAPLVQCLDAYAADVPEQASFRELVVLASDHAQAQPDQDCLDDVGYATWDG